MMQTIPDIVAGFKRRNSVAFVYKTGFRTFRYSYQDVHEKILQTAQFLKRQGLKKGDKILLWGYNSPEWGIVFLAASLTGIILVPIDYLASADFVEKIHTLVQAKALFHSEYKIAPHIRTKQFIFEYLHTYIKTSDETAVQMLVTPNDILEIVYTSGTTGDPKGVILTHKNVMTNLLAIKKIIQISDDMKFLSLLPLSHLFEQNPGFFVPLSAGATIVYMRGLRPSLLFKTLHQEKITTIIIVPRLLQLLADGIQREIATKHLSGLVSILLEVNLSNAIKKTLFFPIHKKFGEQFQFFVSGGAPLSEDLHLFWQRLGFTILQGYGLTECSPVLTANNLDCQRLGSVGRALHGVEVTCASDGEIMARGDNLTQGYYEKEKETKALFDGKWMKTGDIGAIDDQGYLFIKGRKKDVIVTSAGLKVYPDDIEQVLLKNRSVKDACVIGIPTINGEEVHAEVLLQKKTDLKRIIATANSELNESQQILSYGLWPQEDFPRTTTMKIKKNVVLQHVRDQAGLKKESGNVKPLSKLYRIIAEVCRVDVQAITSQVTLASDLKLSSINRVELVSILEQEFNADINEEEITARTTVAQLENIVQERKNMHQKDMFHRWLLLLPMRFIRILWNTAIADRLIKLFCRRTVLGTEHLVHLKTPVIFIANHVGYFDTPNILMSLPTSIRYKTAPAAWKEYFDIPKRQILKRLLFQYYYYYASFFVNIYLFPKQKGFKKSLEYTGELLDNGWNILFFPEGEHSPTGTLQPFRSGIGWLVKEMRVPIVPVKHSGLEQIMAGDEHQIPKFGAVTIQFGKPVFMDYTKSIPEITTDLHNLIQKM